MKLSNEIKTAILVLSGILMFIVGFSYLKSNNIFSSDRIFFAIYDDVEGVSVGTPVTVSGATLYFPQKTSASFLSF